MRLWILGLMNLIGYKFYVKLLYEPGHESKIR